MTNFPMTNISLQQMARKLGTALFTCTKNTHFISVSLYAFYISAKTKTPEGFKHSTFGYFCLLDYKVLSTSTNIVGI